MPDINIGDFELDENNNSELVVKDQNDTEVVTVDPTSETTTTKALDTDKVVPMKLGILPDVHWESDSNNETASDSKGPLDNFIDKMNSWGADFVVQTGDLVEKATSDFSGTKTAINEVRNYIENTGGTDGNGLNAEIVYTVGNHEQKVVNGGDIGEIYSALGFGSTLESTFTTHEINGWKLIQFNSAYTTNDTNNAADDNRIPDSSDPFDGLSWLEQELDTDKPVISLTHYAMSNATGGQYQLAFNAYQALQKFADADSLTLHIHGHSHGDQDWDCGKQSVGPFGQPFFNAGHICKGDNNWYTYSNPPTSVYAYGTFYHPRKYNLNTTLNEIDRANFATDAVTDRSMWHPQGWTRGNQGLETINLGGWLPAQISNSGSAGRTQNEQLQYYQAETGTTSGSWANARWRYNTTRDRWGTLEGFRTEVEFDTIGASNDYECYLGRGLLPRGDGSADDGYGFKIDGGNLYGAVYSDGTETLTSQLDTFSQGDNVYLSATLFSPHICRFYWLTGSSWSRAEIVDNTAVPLGTDQMEFTLSTALKNNVAEDYRLRYSGYRLWKLGY